MSAPDLERDPPPVGRRERIALGLIVIVALFVRLAHIREMRGDVLFDHPPLDEERYVMDARTWAGGMPFAPRPFWQPPGILIVLGAVFRLFGPGLMAPRVLQACIGAATCALVWAIARRLFGARVALAAAAILALHGMFIFAGGELLPAIWAAFFEAAALLFLLDARGSLPRAVLAGLLLGSAVLFTPVTLPFGLLAALWLGRGAARRAIPFAFLAALAVAIVPVAVRNYRAGGELVLVSTNGGLNFFLGNNPLYPETLAIRPGPRWTELTQEPWRQARISEPGAMSSWFFRRGARYWLEHPLDALGHYLRKVWLYLHASEITRDTDVYAMRGSSRVLRALVGPRPLWLPGLLLMPLATIGIVDSARRRKGALLLVFVLASAATVAMFFVSARYRVPAVPILSIFSAAGAAAIVQARGRGRAILVTAALALSFACAWPAREVTLSFPAEPDLFRGLAKKNEDRPQALESFRRATVADPTDPRPWVEMGNVLDTLGRKAEAADAWEHAGACDPSDLDPRRRAADTRQRLGDVAGAIRALEANVSAAARPRAEYVAEHTQLVVLQARLGDEGRATEALRTAFAENAAVARTRLREFGRTQRTSFVAPAFWATFDLLVGH